MSCARGPAIPKFAHEPITQFSFTRVLVTLICSRIDESLINPVSLKCSRYIKHDGPLDAALLSNCE